MNKENIYQVVWYTDTDTLYKREKNGKFEKTNKTVMIDFCLAHAKTFKTKKNSVSLIITKN